MKGISWSWKQNKMILKQNKKEREREMDGERESLENLACQIINMTQMHKIFFCLMLEKGSSAHHFRYYT